MVVVDAHSTEAIFIDHYLVLTERWQQMWREADQDVAGARLRGFELARPLLADLDMA